MAILSSTEIDLNNLECAICKKHLTSEEAVMGPQINNVQLFACESHYESSQTVIDSWLTFKFNTRDN